MIDKDNNPHITDFGSFNHPERGFGTETYAAPETR